MKICKLNNIYYLIKSVLTVKSVILYVKATAREQHLAEARAVHLFVYLFIYLFGLYMFITCETNQ